MPGGKRRGKPGLGAPCAHASLRRRRPDGAAGLTVYGGGYGKAFLTRAEAPQAPRANTSCVTPLLSRTRGGRGLLQAELELPARARTGLTPDKEAELESTISAQN